MTDSASNFLKGARAMDDFALQQRVRAATLFHGATLLTGAVTPARNFAVAAFMSPTTLDPTMLALVCTTPAIATAVIVPTTGDSVDTTPVPDSAILDAVRANWPIVAAKYKTDPLAPPAA